MKDAGKKYYRAVSEIFKSSHSSLGTKRVLLSVVRNTIKALEVDGCSVLLLDETKHYLIPSVAQGLSDWYLRKGPIDAVRSLGETMQGKVVYIADATSDPRVQYPDLARRAGITSIISIPIPKKKNEIVGELRLYNRQPREFTKEEQNFLVSVADLTSLFLENAYLEGLIRQQDVTAKAEEGPTALTQALREPLAFGHPSEEDFARLLDFYRVEWLYEPRTFVLGNSEQPGEMFTPDFYLPEMDSYIELTTSKQRLMTEKNRKIRRLKELYPEVNIRLLNKKDYFRMLAKYGYGPLAKDGVEAIDRVMLSSAEIQRRVRQLAKQISADYTGQRLLLVGVLKGVIFFMADLMRHLTVPLTVDFLAISYYTNATSQAVRITKDLDRSRKGAHILLVEDIVDTGMTAKYILHHLESHKPSSLRVCTLLDKRSRRLTDVKLDYVGFEIGDEFAVGYGLDHKGEYRNLSFIGVLKPDLLVVDKSTSPGSRS